MKAMAKFKEYNQQQIMLMPPNLEDKVPQEHLARFISRVVNQVDTHGLCPWVSNYLKTRRAEFHGPSPWVNE